MKTFKDQYEKLITAYLNNEVVPMSACACFVGNLLNGCSDWYNFKLASDGEWIPDCELEPSLQLVLFESDGTYTIEELLQIEGVFMRVWKRYGENEESLFKAFEVALVLLRQIHESKGEIIDDYVFKKRVLSEAKLEAVC